MIALQDHPGKAIAASDSYIIELSSDLFYNLHCDNPQDFGLLRMNLSRDMARVVVDLSNALIESRSLYKPLATLLTPGSTGCELIDQKID